MGHLTIYTSRQAALLPARLIQLFFVLFFLFHPDPVKAEWVFILHSYHQEYPWTEQENRGLVSALKEHFSDSDLSISTEYLDTKRIAFTHEYQDFFANYLKGKYKGSSPDILFVSDDNALQFMVQFRDRIFPGVPVVFCGINDTSFKAKFPDDTFYGVFEIKDIAGNLHLVKKLFPYVDSVTFVGDDSPTYQAIYRQILASAVSDLPKYSLNFKANRDIRQVEYLLKATADPVIVLTTIGAFHDEGNTTIPISSAIGRIRKLGNFAIVSMEDVYMRDGVLGGIVTSGQSQGRNAAEIGIKILSGNVPEENHFVFGANVPTLDHRELKRLGISSSQVPEEAVLLNQPVSFWKEFREIVLWTLALVFVLCSLISFLLVTLSRKRRVEKELRESRNFLNSVLDNLPDMVFVKNADTLRFVRLNKAGEKIFGAKAEQIVGKNDYDFFPREEADFFTAKDREVLDRKELLDIPVEPIQAIAGKRYLHTQKIPIIDEDGRPVFLLGISRDITEEQAAAREKLELQDKLRQAQKMEAIGTLAGGIAHDFNNILSAIIGYTQLAQLQPDLSEQLKKHLDGIFKGADRAKQLVRQILTFSRKNEQNHKLVMFAEVVSESLELLRSTLPSTINIKHSIQCASHVVADATQLQQVVMNLCTNGYQAMQEKGGTLEVSLNGICVSDMAERPLPEMNTGWYAQLTVSDSGKGIAPEVIERIFDPYFTTKGPEAGTGLGLAVVHGIIKSHGGFISVKSAPDAGTKVSVYLPIADMTEHMDAVSERPGGCGLQTTGKGERILLVDDEPDIVATTEVLLSQHGYHVTSFTSSIEALRVYKARQSKFDIVITDMTMPELTGAELSARIIEIDPEASIILCTGFSEGMNRGKAAAIGIKGYCEKPVAIDVLLDDISSILANSCSA